MIQCHIQIDRKEILAEEYIGGDEFTIDGLVVNGNTLSFMYFNKGNV